MPEQELLDLQFGDVIPPTEKNKIIQAVTTELSNLRKEIRNGNLKGAALEMANKYETNLQEMLNKFLAKKGVITPQEKNDALDSIDESKKLRLKKDFKLGVSRTTTFIVASIVIIGGIWWWSKRKN
jgi:5-methylcytosine-specific restriction endonuclease McrBC regulatory subunit McrC